jgi:hypothetical protein
MYGEVLGGTAGGAAVAGGAAAAGGALPFTGFAIPVLGVTITLSWIVAFALVAVAVGVLLIRLDARRG